MYELIRKKFGEGIDPLTNVAPALLEEARRTVTLWGGASRSELRQLISAVRRGKDDFKPWKMQLVARTLARRALGVESESVRKTVLAALAALDQDFSPLASL